jgi:hypothetical protein
VASVRLEIAVADSPRLMTLAKRSELAAALYPWILLAPQGLAAHGTFEEDAERLSLTALRPFRTICEQARIVKLMELFEAHGLVRRYSGAGRSLVAILRFRSNGAKAPATGWQYPPAPGLVDEPTRWNVPKDESAPAPGPLDRFGVKAREVLEAYSKITGRRFASTKAEEMALRRISGRLGEGYTPEDLIEAVHGATKDPFYKAHRYAQDPDVVFLSAARIEKLRAANRMIVETHAKAEAVYAEENSAQAIEHGRRIERLRRIRDKEAAAAGYEEWRILFAKARPRWPVGTITEAFDLVFVRIDGKSVELASTNIGAGDFEALTEPPGSVLATLAALCPGYKFKGVTS